MNFDLSYDADGKFSVSAPKVSNVTDPSNQVALVAALTVPITGKLGANHELSLKTNLNTLISSKTPSAPSLAGSMVEYKYHGFHGAGDVMVSYDASESVVKVGYSTQKIKNTTQFNLAVSRGLSGQTASEDGTIAVVVPSSIGEFNVNLGVQQQLGTAPTGSVGVGWKWTY